MWAGRGGWAAAETPRPKARYAQFVARMNPGSGLIEVPFNEQAIFPRDKSIRLELLEFSLCREDAHKAHHFSPAEADEFPIGGLNRHYDPQVPIRVPVPLPIAKRRRTVFYVPVMGPELMPLQEKPEVEPDEPGLAWEGEGGGPDVGDDPEWFVGPREGSQKIRRSADREESPPAELSIRPARQAQYLESRIEVEARFKSWRGSRQLKFATGQDTFTDLINKAEDALKSIYNTEFCGLPSYGRPSFEFTESEGQRTKSRVTIKMPPKTWLFFSSSEIFKMLGFDPRAKEFSESRRAGNVLALRNKSHAQISVTATLAELNPKGFLAATRGMTEALDTLLQRGFEISMALDAHIYRVVWETDRSVFCRPQNAPDVRLSLFTLNCVISIVMELMMLHNDRVKASTDDSGKLYFLESGHLQPEPVDAHTESNFVLTVDFGAEAAQSLGILPRHSPLRISSGKDFESKSDVFYRFGKAPLDRKSTTAEASTNRT